jgi:hypothetical protein
MRSTELVEIVNISVRLASPSPALTSVSTNAARTRTSLSSGMSRAASRNSSIDPNVRGWSVVFDMMVGHPRQIPASNS